MMLISICLESAYIKEYKYFAVFMLESENSSRSEKTARVKKLRVMDR